MASKQECEAAFAELAAKLGGVDDRTRRKMVLDRSVSAQITDLPAVFQGRLRDGGLHDIVEVDASDAQIKLTLTSDTLLGLTAGTIGFGSAWAGGKLKIDAGIRDLLKLRSMF